MLANNGEFHFSQQEDVEIASDRARCGRMSPAMRAGLDALEREFTALMSGNSGNQASQDVEKRIDVARRLLDISAVR
jgi:hypothetical protein